MPPQSHVLRYLESLPDGFDSFPDCRSKASIFRPLLERNPVQRIASDLPCQIRELIERPPPPSTLLPTVWVNAVELAVIDEHGMDEAAFRSAALQMNAELLGSRLYSALVYVSSPAFLLRLSASVWGRFHKGTQLRATCVGTTASLRLQRPDGLFPPMILLEKAAAFAAALTAAGGIDVSVDTVSDQEGTSEFHATWRAGPRPLSAERSATSSCRRTAP